MKRAAALSVGLAGLASVVALAAATVGSGSTGAARSPAQSVTTVLVGPGHASPARVDPPAGPSLAGGSTSQVVSGRVASTTGVLVTAGSPSYHGTEPATMTVRHRGAQVTVTVAPR